MEMDYPKTRMDNFFAKAAGSELADNSMEPITDREYWINEMAAKIAQGGGGGGNGGVIFVTVTLNDESLVLNKTYNELHALLQNGIYPILALAEDEFTNDYLPLGQISTGEDYASASFINTDTGILFEATGADENLIMIV